MKILYSWLKDFIKLDGISINDICENLTKIGLEVEDYEEYGQKINNFEGLVVGEVVECYKHPNADKLNCTKINIDNSGNLLNIVCGAPNVRKGLKVVVAKENTLLTTYSGEQFKIKKSKIRGEVSEGMLCAEDEIGLSNNHECIIELDSNVQVGTPISKVFNNNKEQDYIINVDLTPNRGYCASYLGIARDLKTVIKRDINDLKPNNNNDFLIKNNIKKLDSNILNIVVEDKDICKRYCGIVVKNVNITESSDLIKYRLKAVGVKSINNVVDITNYMMFSYGQPMHVYDLGKIKSNIVKIKLNDIENNKFKALNNEEYNINNDIVITDNDNILSLGGIIGGLDSAITDETKNILFESAFFNSSNIRKTCNKLKIRTEASYRFERIVDENNTFTVILKGLEMLLNEQNNVNIEGFVDINNIDNDNCDNIIKTNFDEIYNIIGQKIDEDIILEILKNLDIDVKSHEKEITLSVPNYRKNIEFVGDIVDEILRIYGYNNLNLSNYNVKEVFKKDDIEEKQDLFLKVKDDFTDILCSNGFFEIRTNSLISKSELINKDENYIELLNPSSSQFEILRTELIFSGLNVINYNINRDNNNLKLFEFGKIYRKNNDKIIEKKQLSLFLTGCEDNNWESNSKKYTFFDIKKYYLTLLSSYKLQNVFTKNIENEYIKGLEIIVNGKNIGYFGQVNDILTSKYSINKDVFYGILNIEDLVNIIKTKHSVIVDEISKYQQIKRDLSLILDNKIKYEQIESTIKDLKDDRIKNVELFSIYQDQNIKDKKTYSISIYISDNDKNLNNDDIHEIMDKIILSCKDELEAIILS